MAFIAKGLVVIWLRRLLWDTHDLEGLVELFYVRWDQIHRPTDFSSSHTPKLHHLAGQPLPVPSSAWNQTHLNQFDPVSASIIPSHHTSRGDIYVAVLFASASQRLSRLEIYSTKTAELVTYMDIPGIGVQIKLNRQLVVVATKSPLALHIFTLHSHREGITPTGQSRLSLKELPYSPILDLTPKPKTGEPIFCLGLNRLLAYASNKAPHEREPPIATGQGFSFATTHQEARSPSKTDSFGSMGSSVGTGDLSTSSINRHNANGTSWKHSVSHNLDTIDETARKVGGGLLSGAKLLTSWGQHVLMNGNTNGRSPDKTKIHANRRDSQSNFSKSAPLPYMMNPHDLDHSHNFGREMAFSPNSTDDSIHSSSSRLGAHPESERLTPHELQTSGSTLHAENPVNCGNVKVVDLLPSSDSKPQNRHYQPISHFKISTDPLLFLSFNPSSTMLLTSSIDAHSFHIFELRPYSRVGKSCISGRRSTGSHREATVWHRYKLVRGYTSADVRDVVWAWDSKIVTVVTDRGTHHLFAIHPAGGHNHPTNDNPQYSSVGTPDLPSILTLATSNPLVFQPLSITISSFTTIKPKHILRNQNQSSSTNGMIIPMISKDQIESNETHESETDHHHLHHHSQTSFIFLQPNDEQMNEERSSRREEFEKVLNPLHKRLPSGLLFDHLTQSVVLYNLDVKKKLMSLSSSHRTVSSPTKAAMISEHHSKPRKKSAPSGLSQLMQQQADLNEPHHHHQSHSVNCTATVIWSLLPNQPQMEQTRLYETEDSNGLVGGIHQVKKLKGERWTSFVELDTFSHSINILPKSIYTYHQFDFYHFKETYEQIEDLMKDLSLSSSSLSSSSQRRLKKLIVRQEVIIEPGGNPNEVPGEFINLGFQERNQMNAIRYEEPIKSAVETILDTSAYHPTLTRNFLMNPSPGFPNGQPGKRGGHHQFKVLSRLSLQNATKRISSNSTNGSSKAKEEKISISFDDGVIKVDSSEEDEDEDEDEVSPISDLDVEEEEEKIGWDAWAIDEEEFGKQPIPVQVQVQVEVEKNAGGGGGGASSSTEAFSITDTNTTRTTDSSTSDGTGSGSGSGSGSGLGGGKVKGAQKSKGSNGARNGRGPRRS
ncbi:uncharacterized protein MELLADRAFT_115017 [Melampsora larici-populina 98AG31]|uniref:BCAS3 WD40 domain-containing protein n=1 Tax=Melampsora larici-populina (strain 98AG31 / pathotype 3-4-7) TaxID=747676 RepID=F4R6E6_MELLP|nr:uncharacterized protein MELLADRAFT_115017 [Melampsora larici-populina 98AG31]EGG11865.1 hypothetical protein MELLADRAFT_115017 [Melampsora larici-populina 98AG31]